MRCAPRLRGACLVGLALLVGAGAFACSPDDSSVGTGEGALPTTGPLSAGGPALGSAGAPSPVPFTGGTPPSVARGLAPLPSADPNPLALPPRTLPLQPGDRVFAVAGRMLSGAKLGSSLRLEPAAVLENQGETLLLQPADGRVYRLHPGYVLPVPAAYTPRPLDPVLTVWGGELRHAVVTKVVKDRALARLLDLESRLPEQLLPKGGPLVRQSPGLNGGNYALWEPTPGELHHVLLVSALDRQPPCWFVLDYGGAARLADASQLRPLPLSLALKPGSEVLAENLGRMVPAKLLSLDLPGFAQVRFDRAGAPSWLGAGKVGARNNGKPD